MISTFEAILDDPRQLLQAQQSAARGEAIADLKADGVDYTERMALIEDVTYPKPLEEELEDAYDTFVQGNPWAREFELSPKSVVRDMIEHAMTFSDLIATYGLARSEGVVLRYLTDAWRTLSHSVPEVHRNEELDDIIAWLGELIRQVDSSLIDEWAHMADENSPIPQEALDRELAFGVEDPSALTANRRAFRIMVRNHFFRMVELFAAEKEELLAQMVDYLDPGDRPDWPVAMDEYFDEYDDLLTGPDARGPEYFRVADDTGRSWQVVQIFRDPEGDNSFQLHGVVDLDASDAAGEVRLSSLNLVSR